LVGTLESLEQRAIDCARRGDFGADARKLNEEITRLAPAHQGAWTRLARCCMEMGQLDEATAALDAALQLNPQNTIARNLQIEVSKRRAGPAADAPARRRRAPSSSGGGATARAATRSPARAGRAGSIVLPGIGRTEFVALAHLPPASAAESLTARIEPLLMALNDRPFAARVVDARNRAGRAGDRLFRRGSLQPVAPGQIEVFQQGGRWEPQLNIRLCAAPQWRRDSLAAGIAFDLSEAGGDERAEAERGRAIEYFEAFQQHLSSAWRQHLTDWMRTNGGFVQQGMQPASTDVLPYDAVQSIITEPNPAALGRIFVGRWLFADRGDDIGVLADGGRLVRWIEATFTDLLPLWGTVYRERYAS
jgi:tetratricopeptide (TPR) repeat protein